VKLKFKIPLLLVGLILLSNIVLGVMSYRESSQMVIDREGELFGRIVKDYQKSIDLVVEIEKQVVKGLTNRIDIIQMVKLGTELGSL